MLNATVVFKTLRRLGCSNVMVSPLSAGEDKKIMVPLFGSKSVQESIAQRESGAESDVRRRPLSCPTGNWLLAILSAVCRHRP